MSGALKQYDDIVERLIKQRQAGIQYATFLRDVADNESRWNKYKDSFSGNVVNMQIVAVEACLVLYCSRLWDCGRDNQSIPNAITALNSAKDALIQRRQDDLDSQFLDDLPFRLETQFANVNQQAEVLGNLSVRDVIRIIRTEHYAHLVENSRDRAKTFPDGFDDHGVTRLDVINFARDSTTLVEDLELLRSGTHYDFDESSEVFQNYCDQFWLHLPTFSEVE